MMVTWRRAKVKHETRDGEGYFQEEEAWMAIEQEDTIVYHFILIQHLVASFRIADPRSSILVSSVTLTSGSSSLKLLTTQEKLPAARPTLIISVLFGLTSRPSRLSPVVHLCTSLRTDSGEPPNIALSRYQTFSSDSTPLAI